MKPALRIVPTLTVLKIAKPGTVMKTLAIGNVKRKYKGRVSVNVKSSNRKNTINTADSILMPTTANKPVIYFYGIF